MQQDVAADWHRVRLANLVRPSGARAWRRSFGGGRRISAVVVRALALLSILLLVACASAPRQRTSVRAPAEVRAQLEQLLPASLAERHAWAADIEAAFRHLDLIPSTENLCAALAVTEQESGFKVDPPVPDLGRISREEIIRRAARLKIPQLAVDAALKLESTDGRSYGDRLDAVRTEKQLSELFEEFIGRVPLGARLFAAANPIHTGGPMQVSIEFSELHADRHGYPYAIDGSVRQEVFSRRGGMYFGIAHLLDYPNSYQRHLYRYADFNAGWYASRNAAFQAAVNAATGVGLVLDGDLILHERGWFDDSVGATEAAVLALAPQLELSERRILNDLQRSTRHEFEDTELFRRMFDLAETRAGRTLPRAAIPRITLESPKITRRLTTEWFATRVQMRYQRCVNRAFGL